MTNQINILLAFFITGILIGIIFDVFRIRRKTFNLPDIFIYMEDVIFWILAGCLLLFSIFTFAKR